MPSVSDYYPGDITPALKDQLDWMLSRLNANDSGFLGNAVLSPVNPALIQGGLALQSGSFNSMGQQTLPSIVLNPPAAWTPDAEPGPTSFPINYSPKTLPSANLLVTALLLNTAGGVSGQVCDLAGTAASYRVDVYSRTDLFYFQGSSNITSDAVWSLPSVSPGTVMAFLMPANSAPPAPGAAVSTVNGWVSHTNLGVGNRLADYFVRLYVKTDAEYLQEDNIPIVVQDALHARYGASRWISAGTPVAHVIYRHPQLGPIDTYSTAQNAAVLTDLPRSLDVPPGDPSYKDPAQLSASNLPSLGNRSWIYDCALAIIAFTLAGMWDAAQRIVTKLNTLRKNPGYLPFRVLEDAEDSSTARWTLESGAGTVTAAYDTTKAVSGSNVLVFNTSADGTTWRYSGDSLPIHGATLLQWAVNAAGPFTLRLGVTTSGGIVRTLVLTSSGAAGFDAPSGTLTIVVTVPTGAWRTTLQDLQAAITSAAPTDSLVSVDSFRLVLNSTGTFSLDDVSLGSPQPAGSLSFSYDVYYGQVDQAYIRAGAMGWVCYAYGIYMERSGDYANTALDLQDMLNFLISLQSSSGDVRQGLVTLGWGTYQGSSYTYIPAKLTSVSTEHNIDCYFAFDKASKVLPGAATMLLGQGLLTSAQATALQATATSAAAAAAQISAGLINHLYIAPASGVPGHFAQGASDSGLDTSLALDASGTWAAMFCDAIGDEAKAVQCLEFFYSNFFVPNQQILQSTDPATLNTLYQQLTPFDGFKPYADSSGGYAGSPACVWAEGTWGALAALLRYQQNSDLRDFFLQNYSGGLDAFLYRLIQSQQILASTTGDGSILAFSAAAPDLPWEFSVRKAFAPVAWSWITSANNSVLLSSAPSPLSGKPYLKIPQGVEQTLDLLNGQSSIGALDLEILDKGGFMTALAGGAKLEGRKVSLKVGYPGLASTDFATLATQQIDSVTISADATSFILSCLDLKRSAKTNIFSQGDDGFPTSSDHPRTLIANPVDVALMVFQNELGVGQASPDSNTWRRYDPSAWDASGTVNPTLINPNPYLDVASFLAYRHTVFAGYLFEFSFAQSIDAKQFLEYEIFHPLSGCMITLADGRISPNFFIPPSALSCLFEFNPRNIVGIPQVTRQPLINQITFRLDYDGSQFGTELLFVSAPSLQRYGLSGQQIIESKGMTSLRGGISLAGLTSTRFFSRYAGIDPVSGVPSGGAVTLSLTSHFQALTVEVGDYVYVTHPLLPDFSAGRRGIVSRVFLVIDKQPNYTEGSMSFQLLDANWLAAKDCAQIAPASTPVYTQATPAQKRLFMFVSSAATGCYSDGSRGVRVF